MSLLDLSTAIFLSTAFFCQKHKGLEVYASVKIVEAIENNPCERKDLLLWLFRKAGQHNSNNIHHQFWQQHCHPIELNTNEMFDQRLDYIHNNPVIAGIVRYPEQYLYSSAGSYARLPDNVLEIMPV